MKKIILNKNTTTNITNSTLKLKSSNHNKIKHLLPQIPQIHLIHQILQTHPIHPIHKAKVNKNDLDIYTHGTTQHCIWC